MYKKHPELKESILKAYEALDSKYGYKTFNEYFDREDAYKVGRIVNLPRGTAENAATYIHGAMFAVRSLLLMNEGKKAFEQISKLIPLTHNKISVSPFVMPNSYGYNKELGIDGESMNDWYTGSSNTLLKAIIFDMFGIKPKIGDEVEINPVREMPSKEANISLTIKGKRVDLHYRNEGKGKRTILVNGNELESNKFDVSDYPKKITIEVID
jgi:cellobiose phosphorylase